MKSYNDFKEIVTDILNGIKYKGYIRSELYLDTRSINIMDTFGRYVAARKAFISITDYKDIIAKHLHYSDEDFKYVQIYKSDYINSMVGILSDIISDFMISRCYGIMDPDFDPKNLVIDCDGECKFVRDDSKVNYNEFEDWLKKEHITLYDFFTNIFNTVNSIMDTINKSGISLTRYPEYDTLFKYLDIIYLKECKITHIINGLLCLRWNDEIRISFKHDQINGYGLSLFTRDLSMVVIFYNKKGMNNYD